jgi:hypothetical protein
MLPCPSRMFCASMSKNPLYLQMVKPSFHIRFSILSKVTGGLIRSSVFLPEVFPLAIKWYPSPYPHILLGPGPLSPTVLHGLVASAYCCGSSSPMSFWGCAPIAPVSIQYIHQGFRVPSSVHPLLRVLAQRPYAVADKTSSVVIRLMKWERFPFWCCNLLRMCSSSNPQGPAIRRLCNVCGSSQGSPEV